MTIPGNSPHKDTESTPRNIVKRILTILKLMTLENDSLRVLLNTPKYSILRIISILRIATNCQGIRVMKTGRGYQRWAIDKTLGTDRKTVGILWKIILNSIKMEYSIRKRVQMIFSKESSNA